MKEVLIGAPVFKRNWILPYWFENIASQQGDYNLSFVFCVDETRDLETIECIEEQAEKYSWPVSFVHEISPMNSEERKWSHTRYMFMTRMRNQLLDFVRDVEPDKYFSLDTDILLENPHTISLLDKATDTYADAANPLTFMTKRTDRAPSFMRWYPTRTDWAYRPAEQLGEPLQVDVIMAAKMMSKPVYSTIDYYAHQQGEDLGWSDNCRQKDFKLYCLTNIYAAHIMSKALLEEYLEIGDKRKRYLKSVNLT